MSQSIMNSEIETMLSQPEMMDKFFDEKVKSQNLMITQIEMLLSKPELLDEEKRSILNKLLQEKKEKVLREVSYSLFQYQPLNRYLIDGYNQFLKNGLKKVIENSSFSIDVFDTEYKIKFEWDGNYKSPEGKGSDPMSRAFPNYYRTNKDYYCFNIKIKLNIYEVVKVGPNTVEKHINDVEYTGDIPIMLGSDACNTKNMLREEINECEKDPYGYFVMAFEKALVAQEKTTSNYCYNVVKDKKISCEMLSQNSVGFVSKIALYESKNVIYATLSRLNSKNNALTAVDMLHLFFLVNPNVESKYSDEALEGYFNYFNVPMLQEETAYKKALKDFIGMIYFYTASDQENKDFIPLPLENFIAETINNSTPDLNKLNELVTTIYKETVPNSTAPRESEEYEDEEEEVPEEDDMEMDIEDDDEIGVASSKKTDDTRMWRKWKKLMDVYFFPHVELLPYKKFTFMYMVSKFILCSKGLKDLDNRDDFSVKKVETPGILIQNLFAKSLQNIKKRIVQKIKKTMDKAVEKAGKTGNPKNFYDDKIRQLFTQKTNSDCEIITQTFRNSFVRDTWGDSRTGKKGVTQQVSRFNLPSVYASIRKLSAHSNRQNKIVKPRMIDPSQYMFVAPEETPDNDRIGLMKHLSVSTYISYDLDEEEDGAIFNVTLELLKKYNTDDIPEDQAIVMYNGEIIGFTSEPEKIKNALIKERRGAIQKFGNVFRFMSVLVQQETMGPNRVLTFLKINTNGGRLLIPTFVVGDPKKPGEPSNKLAIDIVKYKGKPIREFLENIPMSMLETYMRRRKQTREENKFYAEHKDFLVNLFENLVQMGVVEYLDAHEAQFSNIALNEKQLRENKIEGFNYSHMTLNPEFMFGVTSAIMTFIGHNPPPRISLYNNHIKQAVSIPAPNFLDRVEPHKDKLKVANYSHKRLIGTYMDEIIGTDEQTIYQNACVCIYPFMGETQEDAIMVKESAIKRGLFSSTVYQTYTVENPKMDLKELPEEVRKRYKSGVLREKIEEEVGFKNALEKLKKKLVVPVEFYKKNNRLPNENDEKLFQDAMKIIPTVYNLMKDYLVKKHKVKKADLQWRDEKLKLEDDYFNLLEWLNKYVNAIAQLRYKKEIELQELQQKKRNETEEKKFKILTNKVAQIKQTLSDWKKKLEKYEKFRERIRFASTSVKKFSTNDASKEGREQMKKTIQQYMSELEEMRNEIVEEIGDVKQPKKTEYNQMKQLFSNLRDLFSWVVANEYMTMNEYAQLQSKLLLYKDDKNENYLYADTQKDNSKVYLAFTDFVNEANKRLENKEAYDQLFNPIENYNKVSDYDEYGKSTNYMDYTKTREYLEDFCKKHDCLGLLKKVTYISNRPVYGERTKVKMDEVIGYTAQGDVEKKILMESEKGVVDRIQASNNNTIYRVRIRDFHIADVGDKIAGPYAQKGVIAAIIPDENLPYVMKNGKVPDVFVNPLAFPSRLTIGMFLEGFLGKIISQSNTRRVKDIQSDFYIPHVRNGVPVFEAFNEYIDIHKLDKWKQLLGLRKNFTSLNDDETDVIKNVRKETRTAIKKIFDEIVTAFNKNKITYDDLSDKDKVFFLEVYGDKNVSNEKLALTFGYPFEDRTKLSDLNKMASNFENFYRTYFGRDFVSLYDLLPEERDRIHNTLEKIKDYGRAFKPYNHEELAELINDLGIMGITEKETMINGQTGNIIGEERYQFSKTVFMKNVLADRVINFDINKASDEELKVHMKDVLACLPELLIYNEELKGVSQAELEQFRVKIYNDKNLLIPRASEENILRLVDDVMTVSFHVIDMFKNIPDVYIENMAKAIKLVDKNMMVSREVAEKYKTTDMVQKVTVPIPINVGNVSYLILKHYVHDKIQERDDGPVDIVTRQSTKGKKNGGGNRFGEMESNAVVAHTVPYFLQERLHKVVDETRMSICQKCGQICSHNAKRSSICPLCRDDTQLTKVTAPFSLKLYADFNTAMGVKNFIYTKVIGKEQQQ